MDHPPPPGNGAAGEPRHPAPTAQFAVPTADGVITSLPIPMASLLRIGHLPCLAGPHDHPLHGQLLISADAVSVAVSTTSVVVVVILASDDERPIAEPRRYTVDLDDLAGAVVAAVDRCLTTHGDATITLATEVTEQRPATAVPILGHDLPDIRRDVADALVAPRQSFDGTCPGYVLDALTRIEGGALDLATVIVHGRRRALHWSRDLAAVITPTTQE